MNENVRVFLAAFVFSYSFVIESKHAILKSWEKQSRFDTPDHETIKILDKKTMYIIFWFGNRDFSK